MRLLPLTPSSLSSVVILLQRPYISFTYPLLLTLRREIPAAAVALFFILLQLDQENMVQAVVFKSQKHKIDI